MKTYTAKCDICGTENTVASYGDWACSQCGQGYVYDEGHQIRLTDSQWALLRNQLRWIPVEERLPEDETPVLVYCIPRDDDGTPSCAGCDGHGGIISTAWYERLGDGDGEHWVSDGLAPPLFWMPLPEPPEVT